MNTSAMQIYDKERLVDPQSRNNRHVTAQVAKSNDHNA